MTPQPLHRQPQQQPPSKSPKSKPCRRVTWIRPSLQLLVLLLALHLHPTKSDTNDGIHESESKVDTAEGVAQEGQWEAGEQITSEVVQHLQQSSSTSSSSSSLPYTKHSVYPEYCSIPSAMQKRGIPPIPREDDMDMDSPSSTTGNTSYPASPPGLRTQILQVTSIIRHGARTPWRPLTCWKDYATFSQGNQWDCKLKSLSAPAKHPTSPQDSGEFLFEKWYDALRPPLHNKINGTCLLGQLIDEGYDMELANGRHLREAYIQTQNPHMQLFDSPSYEERPYEKSTYFRADDEQRTLMSGQILVSGIFDTQRDTIMDIHTADFDQDVLRPNAKICPHLTTLQTQAHASKEYKHFIKGSEANYLRQLVREELQPSDLDAAMDEMVDCLMTTYCTDRPLPKVVDDFEELGDDSHFMRLYHYGVNEFTFHYKYNDNAYSKLAMGPLWAEIHEPLQRTKRASNLQDMQDWNLPRLILVSGHDTTVMPMLASLGVWDGTWMPYASMFIIESHAILSDPDNLFPSEHAFRLVLNGEVITSRMKGCDSDLCDLDILLDTLQPFATRDRPSCQTTHPSSFKEVMMHMSQDQVSLFFVFSVAALCCTASSLITFLCATGKCWKRGFYGCGGVGFPNREGGRPVSPYNPIGEATSNGESAGAGAGGVVTRHDSTYSARADSYLDHAVEVSDRTTGGTVKRGSSSYGTTEDNAPVQNGGEENGADRSNFVIS